MTEVRRHEVVKIFSDRAFLPEGVPHVPMLYPFWGISEAGESEENRDRLDRYRDVGASIFKLTELEEAEIAVLPFDWEFTTWTQASFYPASHRLAMAFVARAREAGVPVVVFYESDVLGEVPVEGALVFGTSLYRSRRKPREFALPGWTEDVLSKFAGGRVTVRRKVPTPTVGFCGYAPPLKMPWGKAKLKELARWTLERTGAIRFLNVVPGSYPRVRAIRSLDRSPRVETNFLIRPYVIRPNRSALISRYSANSLPSTSEQLRPEAASRSKREFFQNMVDSDYVLCSRGFGNYSYRLYESLACGRIPLFLDTDCVLPYDFAIDWKRYCLWVDRSEFGSIPDRVAEFHDALSPGQFEELQLECRRLWEEWLAPEAFFAQFVRHLHAAGVIPTG
jgi:Exostosin family